MGLFDKLKGAMNAVTGGAATVTIEYPPQLAYPGQNVPVRITASSTGAEVKSKGVFVDLRATEHVFIRGGSVANVPADVRASIGTFQQSYQIAPPFVLGPGETKVFEGGFPMPPQAEPTYEGPHAQHAWEVRGRLEAFGNDPDSGFLPFVVGRAG